MNLKEKLVENNFLTDLSPFSLQEDSLKIIKESVKKDDSQVGKIIWNQDSYDLIKKSNDFLCKDLIEDIEEQLMNNTTKFERHPSDYIHCLMSKHVYLYKGSQTNNTIKALISNIGVPKNSIENDTQKTESCSFTWEKLKSKDWLVDEVFSRKGYKSLLYRNDKKKQIVLAFRGFKLKVRDFFLKKDNQIKAFENLLSNLSIGEQTYYAYLDTYKAIDKCKEFNFSLSFTGYGFGAWLAEQSVYFSKKDFEFPMVKAVTFESPGSLDYLKLLTETNVRNAKNFNLNRLNLTTYLSFPNFLNTCKTHIGKVYRVLFSNQKEDIKQRISELIDEIEDKKKRESLKKCFDNKVNPHLNKYSFYLNGVLALFTDGIDLFLNEFDENTGKPKNYKEVLDWPKIDFKPSPTFQNNFAKLFDIDPLIKLIPFHDAIPEAIIENVNRLKDKVINTITSNCLEGVKVIINILVEIYNENLTNEQCLAYYEFNDGEKSVKTEFYSQYKAHYKVKEVNLFRHEVNDENATKIDDYLWIIKLVEEELEKNALLQFSFQQLLQCVSWNYSIDYDKTDIENYFIISKTIEIEKLKVLLDQILLTDPYLRKKLDRKSLATNNLCCDAIDDQGWNKLTQNKCAYFIDKEDYLDKLETFINDGYNQMIIIEGLSGCGKSVLVNELAHRLIDNQNEEWIVRIFDSSEYLSEIDFWSQMLNSYIVEGKSSEEFYMELASKINKNKENKVLFIIENLKKDDESYKIFKKMDFKPDKVKFILTTANVDLNLNETIDKIQIQWFDAKTSLMYMKKVLAQSSLNEFPEFFKSPTEREKIFANIDFILPLDLFKLVSRIKAKPSAWNSQRANDFLVNKRELLKNEVSSHLSFEILNILSYLNSNNISSDLIRALFINHSKKDLNTALDNLIALGELNFDDETKSYNIHELNQIEIKKALSDDNEEKYLLRIILALNFLIQKDKINNVFNNKQLNVESLFYHSLHLFKSNDLSKERFLNNGNLAQLRSKIEIIKAQVGKKSDLENIELDMMEDESF